MGAKVKTIKKVLHFKIEEWLDSIEDEKVQAIARKNVIVTGGSIVSLLMGEKINDFDIYFKTKEATKAVAEYYVKNFKNTNPDKWEDPVIRERTVKNIKGVDEERVEVYVASAGVVEVEPNETPDDIFVDMVLEESAQQILNNALKKNVEDDESEKKPYRVVYMSANAITLSDSIQIVIRFYGDPEQIHKNFDFIHAMSWYEHSTGDVVTPEKTLQCILSKTLHYTGSLYPIASLFRAKKFLERGWRISAGELLKMAWQISELDLQDHDTLREQLTGVDMMYLHAIVDAVKGWKYNNNDEKIDTAYVTEIIDRVFGV
jgi:hypothetical protein